MSLLLPPRAVQYAIAAALQTIDRNLITFADLYSDDTTAGNVYQPRRARGGFPAGGNFGWTTGFWPGLIWLAYDLTGDDTYRRAGERQAARFAERIEQRSDLDTHDLGFLYTLSCVAAWRRTGNPQAKQAAFLAAEHLMTRYLDKVGIIQAWGDLQDPAQQGRTIIDSLMNMPLLYWAGAVSGDPRFAQAARGHTSRVRDHLVRADHTTYHTFYWDPETGAPLYGKTQQGYADDSCWARGEAWGIYGFALNHRYTGDPTFLRTAQYCADYFLAHLPDDQVAYWDLIFTDGSGEERDSSASAIAACGLLELVRCLPPGGEQSRYQAAAETMIASLARHYTPPDPAASNGLLLHSVYDKPTQTGVDEASLWGDYFYLEALTRVSTPDWVSYW